MEEKYCHEHGYAISVKLITHLRIIIKKLKLIMYTIQIKFRVLLKLKFIY